MCLDSSRRSNLPLRPGTDIFLMFIYTSLMGGNLLFHFLSERLLCNNVQLTNRPTEERQTNEHNASHTEVTSSNNKFTSHSATLLAQPTAG